MSSAEELLGSAIDEQFASPVRQTTAAVIRGLCRAWLALSDGKDMIGAFRCLAEARTAVYELLGKAPETGTEEEGISIASLKIGIFDTVELIRKAVRAYDEVFVPGLEPTFEHRESEANLHRHLLMAKTMLDGWMNSRTARQCRRYDRLLSPSRHISEN